MPTNIHNTKPNGRRQAPTYYAHVVFTRTDFPFDPANPHTQTHKRVRECFGHWALDRVSFFS